MVIGSRAIWWIAARIAVLVIFVVVFDLRYIWYINASEFQLLASGLAIGLAAIVAAWAWYPSRVLTGSLALITMKFPLLFETSRTTPTIGFWVLSFALAAAIVIVTPNRKTTN